MALSFTRKSRQGSEIIMSKEDVSSLIDKCNDSDVVTFVATNPKRKNTDTHKRWEAYKTAKTLGEYLKLNATSSQYGDLEYGLMRGHIQVKIKA